MNRLLRFKVADEPWEFDQIHALNYRTFVEEIPQHSPNGMRHLVDRFHDRNTYVVSLDGRQVVGMVSLASARPFSLDAKLEDLDAYLPQGCSPCEIRLLSIEPGYRKTSVFAGLVRLLVRTARERGHDVALISGTTRQLKLYAHLGFEAFGPLVGTADARYQPMKLTLPRFENAVRWLAAGEPSGRAMTSFLPGPVEIGPEARARLAAEPISHRDDNFGSLLAAVRTKLRGLTGATNVAVLLGSGTLANDVVGAQLSARRRSGVILSNGEFGERLIDHAGRWKLDFEALRADWGESFDLDRLRAALCRRPDWLWFVHCETSTGMLNDLPAIQSLCRPFGTAVCVDAISSVGTVRSDLSEVELATAVSGKGIGAYPGLALVFHRNPPCDGGRIPRYLDLRLYAADGGVPFTHSSNLLGALDSALDQVSDARFTRLAEDSVVLRNRLVDAGLDCLVPMERASPGIVTIRVDPPEHAVQLAACAAGAGFSIAYKSSYLAERGWIQIALMGDYTRAALLDLAHLLEDKAKRLRRGRAVA